MRTLDIYLNDHLAGATVGVELSRRAAKSNRGTPSGEFLERLHHEIAEDRRTLLAVVRALGVDISPAKPTLAWIAEKAGRLKLNGRLRGYSPLSRLIELEGLEAGVAGKRSLWQALARAFPDDARLARFDFDELIARAERQLQGTREQRLNAAREALAADASGDDATASVR
ncbi:MAG TPA: hypothetical protein VHS27_19060 [Gaiellales bacterium]|nr:hypothetical protein [Gaiellales bacterium]